MATRVVEWKKPYTWWKAIEITDDKVINLRLRDENNLIIYDSWDDEIYVDLQLPDEITPTDAFPVWVTTGRVIVDNWWDAAGTIICAKTTSWDNIKILYEDNGKLYIDNGTWTFKQIYLKGEVDALLQSLRNYVDTELAKKQDKLIAWENITIAADGKTISATTPPMSRFLSLWNCATWQPISFPADIPFEYMTWDHYMVETVSSATPAVNLRPSWTEYDWTASSTPETANVAVWDVYIYDGTVWLLQKNTEPEVSFSAIAWQPTDNTALANALAAKQDNLVSWTNIKTVNNNSLLGSWNIALNDVKVSATAPSSPTEWMVWYDTTNDQLKVYDWTNWNETGKEYNAGEWIEIKDWPDYSAMQWPAPDGFHVPLNTEWQAVYNIWTALGGWSSDWTNFWIALKLPFAGTRDYYSAGVYRQRTYGYYWSSSRYDASSAYYLNFKSTDIDSQNVSFRTYGSSVRCFKNTPTIPTSSWTKLYWTSIEAGWIFWSSIDWLISLSSNWQTWVTIADKNLGATTVWNSGNTLSEANCGYYYQRWNNYSFPRTWTIANQSTTQVDASNYWPWNYYSSDTFIKYSWSWDSTDNWNLWWWVTWVVTYDNDIINTGVLSVNGQTWAVLVDEFTPWWTATTGYVVTKTATGYEWLAPTGWIEVDSASPIQLTKIWAWTQAQYEALASYDSTTVYLTI